MLYFKTQNFDRSSIAAFLQTFLVVEVTSDVDSHLLMLKLYNIIFLPYGRWRIVFLHSEILTLHWTDVQEVSLLRVKSSGVNHSKITKM